MNREVTVRRLARERLDELEPLWAALYHHQRRTSRELQDRLRTLEDSWRDRRALEERWLEAEPSSFVLVADVDAPCGHRVVAEAIARRHPRVPGRAIVGGMCCFRAKEGSGLAKKRSERICRFPGLSLV